MAEIRISRFHVVVDKETKTYIITQVSSNPDGTEDIKKYLPAQFRELQIHMDECEEAGYMPAT